MRLSTWLLSASLFVPVLLPAAAAAQTSPPSDAARAQAGESFHAGVEAYTHGEFATALAAFQNAYRLAPAPAVRVNMANCFMQLHQPVDALDHFEQFLIEAPNAPAHQRREVERQIADLRRQIAEVRVHVTPESAADTIVSVDGHASGSNGVVRMSPGHHVIEASADGFVAAHTEVDATAGMHSDVQLALHPRSAAPAPTPEPPPAATPPPVVSAAAAPAPATSAPPPSLVEDHPVEPPPPHRGWSPALFVTGAIATGVGAIGTTVFGILALSANGSFMDAVNHVQGGDDPATWQTRGHDAAAQANAMALVSDGCLIFTGVAAAFTVVALTQTHFGGEAQVTVSPTASADHAGVVVGGRF